MPKQRGIKHQTNRLSAQFVRTAPPGFYSDGHGLNLRVDPSGARRWVQRLVIRGKPRTLGLGGYPLVPLKEAREKALANRKLAREGGDPLAEKRRTRTTPTFAEAAAKVIELHRPSWSNDRSALQWESSLRDYVLPYIGGKPLNPDIHRRRDGDVATNLVREAGDRPTCPPTDQHGHEMGYLPRPPSRQSSR